MYDCHFDFMSFPLILAATREDKLLGKYYLFLIHMNTHTFMDTILTCFLTFIYIRYYWTC